MDVTPALFTVAVTVSSMMPGNTAPAPVGSPHALREALAATQIPAVIDGPRDVTTAVRPTIAMPGPTRPAPLVPMYASLIVLQGLDVHVTSSAVQSGAREPNPLMKPVATTMRPRLRSKPRQRPARSSSLNEPGSRTARAP